MRKMAGMSGDVLGILPAAGYAERFGNIPKEMLPVDDGVPMISRACQVLEQAGAARLLVITNEQKCRLHKMLLYEWQPHFIIQERPGIWGAVQHALDYSGDVNVFVMPDTYIPIGEIPDLEGDLTIGLFETHAPERFGVIRDGKVHDKQQFAPGVYEAWGVLVWSRRVSRFWKANGFWDLPQALTAAMKEFGWTGFELSYYHDMASFEDYRSLL